MAIDTRNKRMSAICIGLPGVRLFPDGAITGQPARQHMAHVYSGIAADAPLVLARFHHPSTPNHPMDRGSE